MAVYQDKSRKRLRIFTPSLERSRGGQPTSQPASSVLPFYIHTKLAWTSIAKGRRKKDKKKIKNEKYKESRKTQVQLASDAAKKMMKKNRQLQAQAQTRLSP